MPRISLRQSMALPLLIDSEGTAVDDPSRSAARSAARPVPRWLKQAIAISLLSTIVCAICGALYPSEWHHRSDARTLAHHSRGGIAHVPDHLAFLPAPSVYFRPGLSQSKVAPMHAVTRPHAGSTEGFALTATEGWRAQTLRNNHERRPAFIGRMSTADQPPRLYHVQLYSNDVTVKQREYVSRVLMFVADLSAA